LDEEGGSPGRFALPWNGLLRVGMSVPAHPLGRINGWWCMGNRGWLKPPPPEERFDRGNDTLGFSGRGRLTGDGSPYLRAGSGARAGRREQGREQGCSCCYGLAVAPEAAASAVAHYLGPGLLRVGMSVPAHPRGAWGLAGVWAIEDGRKRAAHRGRFALPWNGLLWVGMSVPAHPPCVWPSRKFISRQCLRWSGTRGAV